jgi:hypothetical protein
MKHSIVVQATQIGAEVSNGLFDVYSRSYCITSRAK